MAKPKLMGLPARKTDRARERMTITEPLRLTRAEQNFATAYGDLLRVHAELNSVARITAGVDEDIPTEFGREPAGQAAAVPEMA